MDFYKKMYDEHEKARREDLEKQALKESLKEKEIEKDVLNEGIDPDVGLFSIQPESFNLHEQAMQKESKYSSMGYGNMDDNDDIDEM